ncbi:hypothetical protein GCM10009839_63070 [Catenulispora yoronensis]|uniref:Ig-like domain-containing protein n=1 Tax=Catenulispora yoronensis TaxID=450799 RepID=A0ABP5GNR0_9ACTN
MRPTIGSKTLRTSALLASAVAGLAVVPAGTASAWPGPTKIYCASTTATGVSTVNCTNDLFNFSWFQSWSHSGDTGVSIYQPYALTLTCVSGAAVSVTLHVSDGNPSWSGTCA